MSYRDGDYVVMRGQDSASDRASCDQQLTEQGCRSIRFEALGDGRLQAHGYLKQMECSKCQQPARLFVGTWCEACSA